MTQTLVSFPDMPYTRPDAEEIKKNLAACAENLKNAENYEAAKEVFLREQALERHIRTERNLSYIRHSIDTRDTFYDEEEAWWNRVMPEIGEYSNQWLAALLSSPFRADFAREYGEIMFINAEISFRSFSPELIPEMQKEAELTTNIPNCSPPRRFRSGAGCTPCPNCPPLKTPRTTKPASRRGRRKAPGTRNIRENWTTFMIS